MKRLWRWAAPMLLVGMLLVGFWWQGRAPAVEVVPPVVASAGSPGATASFEASGVASAVHAASAAAVDSVDVCGVGQVTAADLQLQRALPVWLRDAIWGLRHREDQARSQLAGRLAAGSDLEQVVARLLMDDDQGAALIAARTADPAAYRLGLVRCTGKDDPATPACRALSGEDWARLDPADARPWMRLMSLAVRRGDLAAAEAALREVARRDRLSPSSPELLSVAVAHVQVIQDVATRSQLLIELTGREAALPAFDVAGVRQLCDARGAADPQRRPLCQRVARLLGSHGTDLMEAFTAVRLARHSQLSADQLPYDEATLKLVSALGFAQIKSMGDAVDCESQRRVGLHVAERARRGELAFMLARVKEATAASR